MLMGHVARPRCCRICKISVFDGRCSQSLLLSFLPNIRDCFLRKSRELATQYSFFCMSSTVSGSNSWSFAIIGDHSLEVWQRALRMKLAIPTQPNLPSSSSLLFIFCLLPFIVWKKDNAGDIRKERRRNSPIHGSMNDERDFWNRWSSKEGNLRLFGHPLKNNAFTFTFLPFFTFFTLFWWRRLLIIAWKNTKGDLAIS